jgi:hypothetical protein
MSDNKQWIFCSIVNGIHRLGYLIPLLALIFLIVAMPLPVDAAGSPAYVYDSINVNIDVQSDASMAITEAQTLKYTDGTYHYAYRWIPLDRVDSIAGVTVSEAGQPYTSNPAVRDWIADRQKNGSAKGGDTYAFTTWVEDNQFWIGWWFPATSGMSRTFIVKYTAKGAIRISQSGDEIYWKAIFAGRDVPVNSSRITVHFPVSLPLDQVKISPTFPISNWVYRHSSVVK